MSYSEVENAPTDLINNKLDIICLDKIFGFLPPLEILKMEQVCKRWRDISESAWHNIKRLDMINGCPGAKETQIKQILLRGGHYLKDLYITKPCTSELIMPVIKENCLNVESLVLSFEYSREEDFVGAFENMEKLECISITEESDGKSQKNIDARILESVHTGIEQVILGDDSIPQSPWDDAFSCYEEPELILLSNLPVVLEKFNNLRELALRGVDLGNNDVKAIFRKTTLIFLELWNCDFPSTVSAKSYLYNLKKLNLEMSKNIDSFLHNALITSRDLKILYINDCENSEQFCKDITKVENLEKLRLDEMLDRLSDTDFIRITRECKNLKSLSLINVEDISSAALETIGHLTNLKSLHLPSSTIVNDQVLTSITKNCKNLKKLNLHGHSNNSSLTVESLKSLRNLINLESLMFGECEQVDDTMITDIADNCSKLKSFVLWEARQVTDVSVTTLITKCPLLNFLNLRGSQITVNSLIFATQEIIRLGRQKWFFLEGYPKETIQAFADLDIVKSPFLSIHS